MHATSTPQPARAPGDLALLGYMTIDSLGMDVARLDFYQLLLSCTGEDAAQERMRHALHFRMHGCARASFIGNLDALPQLLARFPLWRMELDALPGEWPRAALQQHVLGPLGQPLDSFLASPGWKTAQDDVWQSVLALALTPGPLADAALIVQLTEVLRVGYFLRLLDSGRCALRLPAERRAVLAAQLLLPEELLPPLR